MGGGRHNGRRVVLSEEELVGVQCKVVTPCRCRRRRCCRPGGPWGEAATVGLVGGEDQEPEEARQRMSGSAPSPPAWTRHAPTRPLCQAQLPEGGVSPAPPVEGSRSDVLLAIDRALGWHERSVRRRHGPRHGWSRRLLGFVGAMGAMEQRMGGNSRRKGGRKAHRDGNRCVPSMLPSP
uniref:Uncharacterized protein n=1 Tax=Oryza punctata TaxID=4537 RepID=A0A0E0K0X3_ORYPU